MKLLPEGIAEQDPNLRWMIATHLRILEDVVRGPKASEASEPSLQEAEQNIGRAVARWDRKAEEAAITVFLRVHIREWLRDFAEEPLLARLFKRLAYRRENAGTQDSMRRPSHTEGHRLAKALLVDVRPPGPLDTQGEATFIAKMLAGHGLVTYSFRRRARRREYIKKSRTIPVYFDALLAILAEWERWGVAIPRDLARWRQEVADGRRRRPDPQSIPPQRPANPTQVAYQMQVQFTIEVLDRLGVPPQGSPISGCGIVAEAMEMDISEGTVVSIWKKCPWRKSFLPAIRKYSRDIAIRHGLIHPD